MIFYLYYLVLCSWIKNMKIWSLKFEIKAIFSFSFKLFTQNLKDCPLKSFPSSLNAILNFFKCNSWKKIYFQKGGGRKFIFQVKIHLVYSLVNKRIVTFSWKVLIKLYSGVTAANKLIIIISIRKIIAPMKKKCPLVFDTFLWSLLF